MKYRKKPVVVDAVQWFKEGDHPEVHRGVRQIRHIFGSWGERYEFYYVRTLEGDMEVTPGDYIITGVKGEHYPCKPDIFEMTYEPVEEN
jgi:hypothetical protein